MISNDQNLQKNFFKTQIQTNNMISELIPEDYVENEIIEGLNFFLVKGSLKNTESNEIIKTPAFL